MNISDTQSPYFKQNAELCSNIKKGEFRRINTSLFFYFNLLCLQFGMLLLSMISCKCTYGFHDIILRIKEHDATIFIFIFLFSNCFMTFKFAFKKSVFEIVSKMKHILCSINLVNKFLICLHFDI